MNKEFRILVAGKNDVAIETVRVLETFFGKKALILVSLQSESKATGPFKNFSHFARDNGFTHYEIADHSHYDGHESLCNIIRSEKPSVFLSAQFSLIIKQPAIDLMRGNLLNLHFSHLPYYRGVAPITRSIRDGSQIHGVTLHFIDSGIDTGDIIAQQKFPIKDLTNRQVYDLCTIYGAILVRSHIMRIVDELEKKGSFQGLGQRQDHSISSYFPKDLSLYSNLKLDGNFTASQGYQRALSLIFEPNLFPEIVYNGKTLKVVSAWPEHEGGLCQSPYGRIEMISPDVFRMSTRDFWLKLWTKEL